MWLISESLHHVNGSAIVILVSRSIVADHPCVHMTTGLIPAAEHGWASQVNQSNTGTADGRQGCTVGCNVGCNVGEAQINK